MMPIPVSRTDIIIELGTRELDTREEERQKAIDKADRDIDTVTARAIELDRANRDLRQELGDAKRDIDATKAEKEALEAAQEANQEEIKALQDKLQVIEKNLDAVLKSQERATKESTKEIRDLKSDLRAEKKETRQLATELRQAKAEKPRRYVIDRAGGRVVATLLFEGEEIPEEIAYE